MSPIPYGWRETSLGDVCEFKYGRSLPTSHRVAGSYPVYGSNGVVGQHDQALTDGPTVIIGRKGSFGEVTFSTGPCWPIDTTYYVDNDSTRQDLRWLTYRLSALGLKELNRAAAIPGLNRDDAYRRRLLLPPLEEQRRIAEVLDRAEELRAKRRQALAHLDDLTQSIFLDMFGDPLHNPMGWPRILIGELGHVTTGNTPARSNQDYYGDHIEWIKSDNIIPELTYLTRAHESLSVKGQKAGRVAKVGSVLVTCIAGSQSSIGNAALADREVAFNQQINAITPHQMDSSFLLGLLRVGKRLIQERSTAGMKGLVSKSRLESISVVDPPALMQKKYAARAQAVEESKTLQRGQLAELDELFAALQDRAFRGEL